MPIGTNQSADSLCLMHCMDIVSPVSVCLSLCGDVFAVGECVCLQKMCVYLMDIISNPFICIWHDYNNINCEIIGV